STAGRNNLWSPANLALTGVSTTPQLCQADFRVNNRVVCLGTPVSFTDYSWNGTPASWEWDIDNNGTVDYTIQNPTHTYLVPGTYAVKLTVSDGVSTQTITKLA